MSGRGLGHTGGTLDKLEAIPGFRVELSPEEFVAQVRDVGIAIIGQTADLVPADKKLYALRDVTATVDNVSLIAASIMSKKIAAGADAIVLDVKVGDGAFMKTLADARVLAETMLALGARAGRDVVCLLTDMDQPLGNAVGNALEIREVIETMRGEGPTDFTELVFEASARLLALSDLGIDEREGRRRAEAAVADGSALVTYERWIEAQGGDPRAERLPQAPVVSAVEAPRRGTSRGSAQSPSDAQRFASARDVARRTTSSTMPWASSAAASAATRSRRATCSPRSTRGNERRCRRGTARLRRVRARRRAAAGTHARAGSPGVARRPERAWLRWTRARAARGRDGPPAARAGARRAALRARRDRRLAPDASRGSGRGGGRADRRARRSRWNGAASI